VYQKFSILETIVSSFSDFLRMPMGFCFNPLIPPERNKEPLLKLHLGKRVVKEDDRFHPQGPSLNVPRIPVLPSFSLRMEKRRVGNDGSLAHGGKEAPATLASNSFTFASS
jgi:hypothetical protein